MADPAVVSGDEDISDEEMEGSSGDEEEEDVFEVEKIVGITKLDGQTMYKVRWSGYGPSHDTYEPYDNLLSCVDMIDDFLNQQKEQKKKREEERKKKYETIKKDYPAGPKLKDSFWDDLEHGRINVFDGHDMYSKVKSRTTKPGSQSEESEVKGQRKTSEDGEEKTKERRKRTKLSDDSTTSAKNKSKGTSSSQKSAKGKKPARKKHSRTSQDSDSTLASKDNDGDSVSGDSVDFLQSSSGTIQSQESVDDEDILPDLAPQLFFTERGKSLETLSSKESSQPSSQDSAKTISRDSGVAASQDSQDSSPELKPASKVGKRPAPIESDSDTETETLPPISLPSKPEKIQKKSTPQVTKSVSVDRQKVEKIEPPAKKTAAETHKVTASQDSQSDSSPELKAAGKVGKRPSPIESDSDTETETLPPITVPSKPEKKSTSQITKSVSDRQNVEKVEPPAKKTAAEPQKVTAIHEPEAPRTPQELPLSNIAAKQVTPKPGAVLESISSATPDILEEKPSQSQPDEVKEVNSTPPITKSVSKDSKSSQDTKSSKDAKQDDPAVSKLAVRTVSRDSISSRRIQIIEALPIDNPELPVIKGKVHDPKALKQSRKDDHSLKIRRRSSRTLSEPSVEKPAPKTWEERRATIDSFDESQTKISETNLSNKDPSVEVLGDKDLEAFGLEFDEIAMDIDEWEKKEVTSSNRSISYSADLSPAELKKAVKNQDYELLRQGLAKPEDAKRYDLESPDSNGLTLLMTAAQLGNVDICELLVMNSASINATNAVQKDSYTALMYACEQGHCTVVGTLLELGAHINIQASNGETALFKAVKRSHNQIVKLLLSHGANFALQNVSDVTALKTASILKNTEARDLITAHVSKLTYEFEKQINIILNNNAKIMCALFPIQSFCLYEGDKFKVIFKHELEPTQQGVGTLLFIAHSRLSPDIRCRLHGTCAVKAVILNGVVQAPLTEDASFVMSFSPLHNGRNELEIRTVLAPRSRAKLVVCAYRAQLIGPPE